jgi:hypothetical protein
MLSSVLMRLPIGYVLLVVACLATARPARADDVADAKKLAQQALELAQTQEPDKLREAITLYKQAFALDPHPAYQCNIGLAYRLLDDLPRAHAMYSSCLVRLGARKPDAVPAMRAQLDEVEGMLPEKHVVVDVVTMPAAATLWASTLAEDETLVAPTTIWLPAGEHRITATASGYQVAEETVTVTAEEVAGHDKKKLRIEMKEKPREKDIVTVETEVPTGRRTAARIALIGGGAALLGGGVMHFFTYRTRQDLAELTGDAYQSKLPTFKTQRAVTIALYGAGAAAVVTGAILLKLSPRHGERVGVSPAPSGDGAMVWLDLSP